MKISRLITFVLSIGFISSIAIVYFYFVQRDFTKSHREFLISINKFENMQADLGYLILKNSLYTYHNQDKIAQTISELEEVYKDIKDSKILKNSSYESIKVELGILEKKFQENLLNTEDYLMYNAGVKNSILFLTRYVENAGLIDKQNKSFSEYRSIFLEGSKILKRFNNTKQMQDVDYINNSKFLLEANYKDDEVQNFIENFNMHASFLIEKFPLFINSTEGILNNHIHDSIEKIRNDFSEIALNDFKALDTFAFILFSVFILSLFTIILLFINYLHENKQLIKTKNSLEHSLLYDHLTDLYNRMALERELPEIEKPHILLINIDNFKHINDIYGNDVGNYILKELAKLLTQKLSTKHKAKVYRLGGDEFGVLFNNMSEDKILEIAECLNKEITAHRFKTKDLTLQISVSIASNNISPIMENADLALKHLKKDFTKRILAYKTELKLKTSVKENMDTIELIKSAIEEDRIVPFFQPIVNLQTSKVEKYESLVRLKLKDGTFLAPFKFLETSKKTTYYRDITKIMIEKTLDTMKEYPLYRFSMNISMIDILDDELVDIMLTTLENNKSVASRFDIELLETENLQDISKVQDFIKKIKKFGCHVLIDDFGSGYSNFSYFSDIDVDVIKIDGSITREITTNERKLHMLTSIYEFTKGMQMGNIAEFVETKEMAHLLKDMGIKYAQGYYFGQPLEKPLEIDDIVV